MKQKKLNCQKFKTLFFMILLFLIIEFSYSQTLPAYNFCCEKTKSGSYCQNALEEECDTSINPLTGSNFRKTPTSCKATSFCKPGCCIDTSEGICMENTPQRVCEEAKGTWESDEKCNIPQCNLGCCILGDQASYVTLTRCKKLSALYGLETNFKNNLPDEATCILTASLGDKGACVFEYENQKTCRFLSRAECTLSKLGKNATTEPKFYKDYLCSADELATNCGPTKQTRCIEGRNEVYFKDSCGNPANIYDSSKINDPFYWKKIVLKSESCNPVSSNARSTSCGNCDFFKGSICSKGVASYGEYSCKDINCYNTENGNNYNNGESWCIYQGPVGLGTDYVGSRHFRHICINGEELIEPCADFRKQMCLQNTTTFLNGKRFSEAACIVNRNIDCLEQTNRDDCLNTDLRDCFWYDKATLVGLLGSVSTSSTQSATSFGTTKTGGFSAGALNPITGNSIFLPEKSGSEGGEGICLPEVPIGLKFWAKGEAEPICSVASATCEVTFEKGIIINSEGKYTKNKECLELEFAKKMNKVCTSIGDCGAYYNVKGIYTDKGVEWKKQGKKITISQSLVGG
jgi:hypothetical protein